MLPTPTTMTTAAAVGETERVRTLLEINNALIANLTRDALFRAIAEAVRRAVPFDRTAIFLHDPGRDVLRLFTLESSLPTNYFALGLEMPANDSHVGRGFREQRLLLRGDLGTQREFLMEERAYGDGVRSYVIVPLVVHGRSIGTLAVASVNPHQYSESDAAFFQEVANQVALAIENMKTYEEIAALKAILERESVHLREEIHREHNVDEIVGSSAPLRALLRQVEQVAPTDSTVLITGETGTGKELIARAIHSRSPRQERPLVKVNCSAISAGLVESELFGHVKGAFTGAIDRRVGRFELAHHGTIFLDEVGDLPLETQVKLLRVLQEREFEPVGSSRTQRVDVRVIAATNRDLKEAVRGGHFRSDLFYRLNVFPLQVPALRERREDVRLLAMLYLSQFAHKLNKPVATVTEETLEHLTAYAWPGNIRELQNVIERAVILTRGRTLELDRDLLPRAAESGGAESPATSVPRRETSPALALPSLEEVERNHILTVLERTSWVIEGSKGAAAILKLHPNTLRSRLGRLGIKRVARDAS